VFVCVAAPFKFKKRSRKVFAAATPTTKTQNSAVLSVCCFLCITENVFWKLREVEGATAW